MDGVFCCILGILHREVMWKRAFSTLQCNVEKALLGFCKPVWNSNCDNTLYQVQLANSQTRHYSYIVAQKIVVANVGSDPRNLPPLWYATAVRPHDSHTLHLHYITLKLSRVA